MISVLSAIEGLPIATPVFTPYVVAAAVLVNWRDFRLGLPLGQGVGNAVRFAIAERWPRHIRDAPGYGCPIGEIAVYEPS